MMESQPSFYRSGTNKVIAGVCAGIAAKLNLDPVVVRLIFVLLTIFAGGGVLAYIILWIVLPERFVYPDAGNPGVGGQSFETSAAEPVIQNPVNEGTNNNTQLVLGILLIAVGGLLLLANFIPRLDIHDLWPVALIVFGLLLLKPSSR